MINVFLSAGWIFSVEDMVHLTISILGKYSSSSIGNCEL